MLVSVISGIRTRRHSDGAVLTKLFGTSVNLFIFYQKFLAGPIFYRTVKFHPVILSQFSTVPTSGQTCRVSSGETQQVFDRSNFWTRPFEYLRVTSKQNFARSNLNLDKSNDHCNKKLHRFYLVPSIKIFSFEPKLVEQYINTS